MLTNSAVRLVSSNLLKNFKFQRNISVSVKQLTNEAKAESNQDKPSTESQPQPSEEIKKFEEKIKKYEGEIADIKDKYIRSLAETENTRVRMRKQVEDAKIFGIQNFCKDLLDVSDTLHLAVINTNVESLDKAASEQEKLRVAKEQVKSIYEGLVLTESKLIKIFEKHGLVKIDPKEGDKFNPNLHEAIFQVPIPNKESGSICTINQKGYKLQERVIRAAKVGVVQ